MPTFTLQFEQEELLALYETYDQIPIKGRSQRRLVAGIEHKIETAQPDPEPEPTEE